MMLLFYTKREREREREIYETHTHTHTCRANREVARAATALHSIVFVTKRPGGYDVLLEALARQTNRNYELICVDELADHRAHAVKEMAAELEVNIYRERIYIHIDMIR